MFSSCFPQIFLRKNKLIPSVIHLLIFSYLGLDETHFIFVWIQEEVEIKLGVDSKCAPEEGMKRKVETC